MFDCEARPVATCCNDVDTITILMIRSHLMFSVFLTELTFLSSASVVIFKFFVKVLSISLSV